MDHGELVFPAGLLDQLQRELLESEHESAAIVLASRVVREDGSVRFLCRELAIAPPEAYQRRGTLTAVVEPAFVAAQVKRARNEQRAIVLVHTHPGNAVPQFSRTDDDGEQALLGLLNQRAPGPHAALVISRGGLSARLFGTHRALSIRRVGPDVQVHRVGDAGADDDTYDRQVRAFGPDGQRVLEQVTVGIAGLGGTGSLVAEYLAHLGIRDFMLVDPDVVDRTNLNRLVGSTPAHVGHPKVEVARSHVVAVRPGARVSVIQDSLIRAEVARRLGDVDFIFGCTDSHGSRAVLNQLAYQYLVPCIDMGVGIVAEHGRVKRISGRVQMLAPGLGCLLCGEILDPEHVRVDLLTDFERQSDPYLAGAHIAQPAVISLNATVTSLAVTMFLASITGVPAAARRQLYDGIRGVVRSVATNPVAECYVCGSGGSIARGDEWPLPARYS